MVKFKDFDVVVRSGEQPLTEYGTENDDPSATNTITRYVEAQSGAKFDVRCKYIGGVKLPGPPSVSGVVYALIADGTAVDRLYDSFAPFRRTLRQGAYWKDGRLYVSDLIFSELNIVEEMVNESDPRTFNFLRNTLSNVGTLEIQVFRSTGSEAVMPTPHYNTPLPMTGRSNEVPEKALKGDPKSLFVKLGEGRPDTMNRLRISYYDSEPFLTVKFKYRSRRALEQLHIVPRPPKPPSTELSNPGNKETIRLVLNQREQTQSLNVPDHKIKAESSRTGGFKGKRTRGEDVDNEDEDLVVVEWRHVRPRTSNSVDWVNVDVVDLTED